MMGSDLIFELKINLETNLPRYSDRAIFPPSILSSIIETYGESSLPHPLIFKVWHNDNSCYIGVKQFSASEDMIHLPLFITNKLAIEGDVILRVELVGDIAKGKSLTLKPLQFYPQIHNWKFFLESKLTNFYTTLTRHDILYIEDGNTVYELFVEAVDESLNTIGIIDTDIVLDVIPLNDIMANQQLEFDKNSSFVDSDKINELFLDDKIQIKDLKPFTSSDFRPQIYKIDLSNYVKSKPLTIKLTNLGNSEYSSLFNFDLIIGMDKFVNLENFRWTTMNDDFDLQFKLDNNITNTFEKSVTINMQQNDELLTKMHRIEDDITDHFIYIVPFNWEFNSDVKLSITNEIDSEEISIDDKSLVRDEDTVKCSNCGKEISTNKFMLHESFCLRNNVKCSCGLVFLKQIPSNHWHCDKCKDSTKYGNSSLLKFKHDKLYHGTTYKCIQCINATEFHDFIDLVINHKASVCPGKLHECQFCYLIVPQGEATYQDKVANLTNHENTCGNKTTECFKCNKILRTKDLSKHLKMHDLDKIQMNQNTKTNFNKCQNENCVIVIKRAMTSNQLGLCDYCFGSLYIPQQDPTNIKLQHRIERKYMIQLTKGCGFDWCTNTNCKTYNPDHFTDKSHKELLTYINDQFFANIRTPLLPVNRDKPHPVTNRLWFCVNESIQLRKNILTLLTSENEYDEELIYKPINELSVVNEDAVRYWLLHNGVKKS